MDCHATLSLARNDKWELGFLYCTLHICMYSWFCNKKRANARFFNLLLVHLHIVHNYPMSYYLRMIVHIDYQILYSQDYTNIWY